MKNNLRFIYFFSFITLTCILNAQIQLKVKVNSISVATSLDCDAGAVDNSDFLFEFKAQDNSPFAYSNNTPVSGSIGFCNYVTINEQNGPFTIIPSSPGLAVFSPTSGVFFDRSYNCKNEVPTLLTLTWRAYENDDVSFPSTTPLADGIIASQIMTYTIPTSSNGTYTTQFTQTSSDVVCPQVYTIVFEIEKSVGAFAPLSISFIDGNTICNGAANGQLEASAIGGFGALLFDWSMDGLGDYNDNMTESGLTAGNYTLVVKDALNCTDTSSVTILSINPPSVINAFTLYSDTVCSGQQGVSYAVSSQTNVIFFWNYSGGVASVTGTGNIVALDFANASASGTLSVFAQNSCSTTPSFTMNINVQSSPNIIVSGTNNMCANTQEVLSASGANTYTWSTGVNTSSVVVSPSITTVYTVSASGINGCESMIEYTMSVLPTPTLQVNVPSVTVCPNQPVSASANGSGSLYIWSDGFIGVNHSLSAQSTTIYTVTNTYTNSCYTQVTFTLDVYPGPNLAIAGNTIVCEKSLINLTASGADTYLWNSGVTTNTNSFIVSNSMTVSVVGTTINGCIDSLMQPITMVPSPTVTITGIDTICQGGTANLIANSTGSVTYSWNNGANTASISVAPVGTFTYSVIAFNGACGDTASHEVVVSLLPSIDFSVSASPICNTAALYTLTASPSGGIYLGSGVTLNMFDPSIGVGLYPITYSLNVSGNCSVAQTQTIEVMFCSGINEKENHSLHVFPNPTTDIFTVQSNQEISSILIYDYLGKLVKMIETSAFESKIDVNDLSKGLYSMTITMKDRSQKVIKVAKE